jgi:hypothetical protein
LLKLKLGKPRDCALLPLFTHTKQCDILTYGRLSKGDRADDGEGDNEDDNDEQQEDSEDERRRIITTLRLTTEGRFTPGVAAHVVNNIAATLTQLANTGMRIEAAVDMIIH